jgi:hypothetical protein
MDVSKLTKAELEQLLNEVVDTTVDELAKSEILAGGPTVPNHAAPGLGSGYDDAAATSEEFGTVADHRKMELSKKPFGDDEENEEDEENEYGKKDKKAKECDDDAEKSNKASADLVKAQMKGMLDISKTLADLTAKVDGLSKSRARDRKSVMTEQEVEVIEKSKDGSDVDEIIKANKRGFGEALCELHKAGKISGKYVTEYELFGASKVPEQIKKSILKEVNLIK